MNINVFVKNPDVTKRHINGLRTANGFLFSGLIIFGVIEHIRYKNIKRRLNALEEKLEG